MSVRRLPHLYPEGCWLFVTSHLHGSLPRAQYPPPHIASAGQAFVWMDRQLDTARSGPLFLRQNAIAEVVIESLFRGAEMGHYKLGAFVIMANHVHVLLRPLIAPSRLLKSFKGYTAYAANRILGRRGEPFWQRESYDHCVRTQEEWERVAAYIENNPVKAELVSRPEDYRWSSANEKWLPRLVGTSADKTVGAARTSARATVAADS